MATQKLLRGGPYGLCRNPMALGAVVFYLGIAISLADIAPLVIVAGIATVLIAWIKFVEEKAMAVRFGNGCRDYRMSTLTILTATAWKALSSTRWEPLPSQPSRIR